MVLAMARPWKHPTTGSYYARKAVPAPLREAVGKSELKESLGTKDPAEARQRFPDVIARFDLLLASAAARSGAQQGRPMRLTQRQLAGLGGEWLRAELARHEDDPGQPAAWDATFDALWDKLDDNREAHPGDLDFTPTPADLAEAEALIRERGIAPDTETVERFASVLLGAKLDVARIMVRRAGGDWSPAPEVAQRPVWQPLAPQPPAAPALTVAALVSAYERENPHQPQRTRDRRAACVRALVAAAGHDDATRIGKAEIRAWKEVRLGAGVAPKTVATDLTILSPAWSYGIKNGHLPDGPNPFSGMAPKVPKRDENSRTGFTDEEAAAILAAARHETGALRWLPWLLALTGARVGEASDAAKEDVRQVDGVWCLDIHPSPGRRLKNAHSQRRTPLHSALIAEGFLNYVEGLPAGSPLFPDLRVGKAGTRSEAASTRLSEWLRDKLKITDRRKVGAHSWRHRMEDMMRRARIPTEAADAIVGHENPRNAGSGYGDGFRAWPGELAKELEKVASPLGSTRD
ncbi:site-specific integrase [Roseomonas sp. NAR14]|uniref:Site-specific integrase n=1 Tax=Roseomonas acroporae TaxID=2937791 RepID=A0A9X1Y4R1_9PROT|nr:site-specific integrase [Roseomonas acroporae]MCK8784174.1 site-specific integrase [Roseomonas acroporae]